ncbi:MAG TPA: alkaline phosphatase family protein [Acidobacteriaceae bacterium]|nr:alkaline phosphatase family protein [Acidobacteriaceae bacterium]
MSRKTSQDESRNNFRISRRRLLVGVLATALSVPALAQSVPFPTYAPGENTSASTGPTYAHPLSNPWVVSDGTILTPAGTQVYLGVTTRAKAIALNPNTSTHTAAVLQMGAPQAVTIFNTRTGAVLQTYSVPYLSGTTTKYDADGSSTGITYTPDGKYLLFSQDGSSGSGSFVAIASVNATTGLLSNYGHVSVPIDVNSDGYLTNVTCYPYTYNGATRPASGSPGGTTGSFNIPCGYPYSIFSDDRFTSYPTGIAISPDGKTAYAVLDNNDTLTRIDLTAATPVEGAQIRVGNVPHSVIISPDGRTAYVSNEAGRIATEKDFQEYSNGTPVVAEYPTGTTAPGTISVVDLASFTVTGNITTGHHPTGMAFWGRYLLVANTYSDTISVIDATMNQVVRTIDLGLPIGVPGENRPAYGAGPNSIAVDQTNNIAYVALYNANAIAVVDLNAYSWSPVVGMIPVGYAPASVVLDTADNALLVANDKGIGTTGYGMAPAPTNTAENSYGEDFGVTDFNTHQDLGTVSIVPIPKYETLVGMTHQVFQNNHWDLAENIWSAAGGSPRTRPVAIPARIGDPSLIKHVFLIIRENRTYDQMLGDVVGGNGDPSLAVFGDDSTYAEYPRVTPNAHTLVQRFPLLDNFYDPSRQSADGHNWILQAMAPYGDDIQSPDWLRDYPSNGGDPLAYQRKGHLFDVAAAAGLRMKIYGEYVEYNTFKVPGCTPTNQTLDNTYDGTVPPTPLPFVVSDSCEPSWSQFYNDTLEYEHGKEPELRYYNDIGSFSPLPNVMKYAVQNFPQFDLGIPDQYRVDVWKQDFARDVAAGTVPQLSFIWIMQDHTTGPPNATAEQADNDLAIGRIVDYISHSNVWSSSAIFIEEDDAQDGVDHVDGHRSPAYVISPYVIQKVNPDGTGAGVTEESTFYTQVNLTRTIEQILGLKPMNQNDLVASPMRTLFVDNPPAENFLPWTHVPNAVPLCYGVPGYVPPTNISPSLNTCSSETAALPDSPAVKALRAGWMKKKAEISAGKYHIPDSEDPDTVSHLDWYEATGFRVPFPGEKTVRPASDFNNPAPTVADGDE